MCVFCVNGMFSIAQFIHIKFVALGEIFKNFLHCAVFVVCVVSPPKHKTRDQREYRSSHPTLRKKAIAKV